MTKQFLRNLRLAIFLLFLSLNSASAQPSFRSYSCYRALKPIVIDGKLTDKGWQDIPWSAPFEDIEGDFKPAPPLETRMKISWDENYLYIAAVLKEPNLYSTLKQRDTIIFHDPDFEVFIDPDSDSRNYYEFEINALGTEMDLLMPATYLAGGIYNINWNFEGLRSAVSLDGTLNDPSDTDRSWSVEMAIPLNSFRSAEHADTAPKPGERWRINFSRVEWELEQTGTGYRRITNPSTGKPVPENNWVWSATGVVNMHLPERWGYLEFADVYPPPQWWVWMGSSERKATQWESLLSDLNQLGIRGILLSADTAVLSVASATASSLGMEVHAWIWTMNRGDADPAWLDYNRLGTSLAEEKAYVGYYRFMNPALPEVKEFLLKKFREVASVPGLKGIQMDYIRYVDAILPSGLQPKYHLRQDHVMPQFDYGYHPVMVNLFKETYQLDPLGEPDNRTDSLWMKFRLEELNKTVALLRDAVHEKKLKLTSAVFPTPEMSKEMVRQDWASWHLDSYFPMVYNNFYEQPESWIQEVMETNKRAVPDARIICGLYLPALQDDNRFTGAVEAALAGGADGVALFSAENLSKSVRKQIRALREQGY